MDTLGIILAGVALAIIVGTIIWIRKSHSCSTCQRIHLSNNWFRECEICGKRFYRNTIALHEDIIEIIKGALGETTRIIDKRNHGRQIRPCGYKHIITLHKGRSVSSYYCPADMPRNITPAALLSRYKRGKRAERAHNRVVTWH